MKTEKRPVKRVPPIVRREIRLAVRAALLACFNLRKKKKKKKKNKGKKEKKTEGETVSSRDDRKRGVTRREKNKSSERRVSCSVDRVDR